MGPVWNLILHMHIYMHPHNIHLCMSQKSCQKHPKWGSGMSCSLLLSQQGDIASDIEFAMVSWHYWIPSGPLFDDFVSTNGHWPWIGIRQQCDWDSSTIHTNNNNTIDSCWYLNISQKSTLQKVHLHNTQGHEAYTAHTHIYIYIYIYMQWCQRHPKWSSGISFPLLLSQQGNIASDIEFTMVSWHCWIPSGTLFDDFVSTNENWPQVTKKHFRRSLFYDVCPEMSPNGSQ